MRINKLELPKQAYDSLSWNKRHTREGAIPFGGELEANRQKSGGPDQNRTGVEGIARPHA